MSYDTSFEHRHIENRRILIVDDNPDIHADFRKILSAPKEVVDAVSAAESVLFGDGDITSQAPTFDLDSALQGHLALEKVKESLRDKKPYAMAFVDVRMPPGWSGVETVSKIWEVYPDLQVVICTAHSDYSWHDMLKVLGFTDRLTVLKKPFDMIEVQQLALSLTGKWQLLQQAKRKMSDLEQMVEERTVELSKLNQSLMKEIAVHEVTQEKLRKAKDAAEAADRAKSDFLAVMSHEIRTPMNGVIGMTDLLIETRLTPKQRSFCETIQLSANALLGVINDVLDFSKIEARKLVFEKIEFDFHEMVESTLELFAERAHRKRIELTGYIDSATPALLRGDPCRLRQVLSNLLSNAIKFTNDGGEVAVRVGKTQEDQTHVTLECEVRDTGIGIGPEAQANLFRAFTQADSSTTRKFGGTGLGLAICRSLVEMMHGQISVKSERGKGATFQFRVKLEKQPAGAISPNAANFDLSKARVLIVDDNATNREVLRYQCAAWKVQQASASSGPEALRMLRDAAAVNAPYDLAILDMEMPDMDGIMLARIIQTYPDIGKTRLILLSSLGRQLEAEELRATGISACLIKPARQARLFSCIAEAMGASPREETERAARGGATSLLTTQTRILLAEDNAINQEVALGQLEELHCTADVVNNGLEAMEALRRVPYDVVLMDCMMPEMDGYEAARHIRESEQQRSPGFAREKRVHIIAMTANAMQGDKEKCLAAGMDDYVSKPVQLADLQRALEKWFSANSAPKAAAVAPTGQILPVSAPIQPAPVPESPPAKAVSEAPSEPLIDLDRLAEVTMRRPDKTKRIVGMYLTQAEEIIQSLGGAIHNGTATEVRHLAHKLGGASSSLGMVVMVKPLARLERMGEVGQLEQAPDAHAEARKKLDNLRQFIQSREGTLYA